MLYERDGFDLLKNILDSIRVLLNEGPEGVGTTNSGHAKTIKTLDALSSRTSYVRNIIAPIRTSRRSLLKEYNNLLTILLNVSRYFNAGACITSVKM
jgi:hypothetical protein